MPWLDWLDRTQPGELTGSAWRALLDRGDCLMILDGVDELQTLYKDSQQQLHRPRSNFLTGLADALSAWHERKNLVLLTSRPYGLSAAEGGGWVSKRPNCKRWTIHCNIPSSGAGLLPWTMPALKKKAKG